MRLLPAITHLMLMLLFSSLLMGQVGDDPAMRAYPAEKMAIQLSEHCVFTGEVVGFRIFCTSPLFPETELSKMAFVELVSQENAALIRKKVLLTHGTGGGELEIPEDLSSGFYYLIAYTNWMKNFGEESFSRKVVTIINPDEKINIPGEDSLSATRPAAAPSTKRLDAPESLTLQLSKTNYETREKVVLNLSAVNLRGGSFAVTVYHREPVMHSAVKKPSPERDLKSPEVISYLPDYLGIRLSGNLTFADGSPVKEERVVLSCPGNGTDVNSTVTDSSGVFHFLLKPEEGEKDVVFSLPGTGLRMNLEEPFWNGFREPPKRLTWSQNNAAFEYLEKKYALHQLADRFHQYDFIPDTSAVSEAGTGWRFYARPDRKILTKDYIRLDSLSEYFWELIPDARLVHRKDGYRIDVIDPLTFLPFEKKPGVFVDGVLYPGYAQIAGLPVDQLREIDVVDHIYYYRDFTFGGIIDIHTKKGDFDETELLPEMIRVRYPLGAASRMKYVTKVRQQSSEKSRIPDLRYLLCWKPEVIIPEGERDTTIEFYTSDVGGDYIISVAGLTSDGKIVRGSSLFTVKVK